MLSIVLFIVLFAIFAATLASCRYAWQRTTTPAAERQVKEGAVCYGAMAFLAFVLYGITTNLAGTHPELVRPLLTLYFVVGSASYAVHNFGWLKRQRAVA